MYLARVIGTIVATKKAQDMDGHKLLIVEPIDKDRKAIAEPHVAIDTAQAGEGDIVACVGSREAALAAPRVGTTSFVPVDAAIIGVVDDMHFEDVAHATTERRA
jgi:microcompartment protein CcmK/EutM